MQTARQREAVAVLKETVAQWGRGSTELMYLAHGLGVAGAVAEGKQVLDEMLQRERTNYVPPDHIAVAYEGLGQREQALRWYEKAVAEHSKLMDSAGFHSLTRSEPIPASSLFCGQGVLRRFRSRSDDAVRRSGVMRSDSEEAGNTNAPRFWPTCCNSS
jgi:hypothetical protein